MTSVHLLVSKKNVVIHLEVITGPTCHYCRHRLSKFVLVLGSSSLPLAFWPFIN